MSVAAAKAASKWKSPVQTSAGSTGMPACSSAAR